MRRSWPRAFFYLLFGPIVWAAHLGVVYAGQSLLCAKAGAPGYGVVQIAIGGVTTAAVLALLLAILAPVRLRTTLRASGWDDADQRLLDGAMRLLSILSLFGVLWAGVFTLPLDACGS
jgi:hypothetical protein